MSELWAIPITIAGISIYLYLIVLILTYYSARSDGERGRYDNDYRKPLFPWAYEKGYARGELRKDRGQSREDQAERNKKRFGRQTNG